MPSLSQSFSFSGCGEDISTSPHIENENVRRVTIKQLLEAIPTGDDYATFKIAEFPLKDFILVSNIRWSNISPFNCITYQLDDGTGIMQANDWSDRNEHFGSFAYAQVHGRLRTFRDHRVISIQRIIPLSDPYEIYYHILHVIHDSLALERGTPPRHMLQDLTVDTSALSQGFSRHLSISRQGSFDSNDWADWPGSATSRPRDDSQLTALEKDIYYCISEQDGAYDIGGVHIKSFVPAVRELNPELEAATLWKALESLRERKFLECTNDDYYYRCI